jgi:hypothetical protein
MADIRKLVKIEGDCYILKSLEKKLVAHCHAKVKQDDGERWA